MKVALVQLDIVCDAKQENYRRAEGLLKKAADASCDLAVLPEVFDTGFSQNVAAVAREGADTLAVLAEMAQTYQFSLVAGFAEPVANPQQWHNAIAAFDRNGYEQARYHKIHPFSFTGEDRYFVPGNQLVTCNIEGIPTALFICYDLRFPEVFRCVTGDVQMMILVANWPTSRREHWETLLKARAIENQCVVIGVNRTGTDQNGLEFPGASHVYGPFGKEITCERVTEELLVAEIDIQEVPKIRRQFPFLQDRRPLTVTL
jgi:predicted amidohydrolase